MIHDELAHAIEQEFGLTHGKDFLVGHPLDPVTKEQCGEPYIHAWTTTKVKKPDLKWMVKRWHDFHSKTYAAKMAREKRDFLLSQTDWTDNKSVSPAIHEKFARYRQLLRDISSQPGFPNNINWPTKPE